jgi:hypothetical protein
MNRHDLVSGLFWLGISIFVGVKAIQLGVGVFSNPGPGFVLFWSSLIFGILSIVLMIRSVLGKEKKRRLSDSFTGLKWSNALIATVALFVYASFLTTVGFLLLTFGFMVLLFTLGKAKPWITVAGAFVTIMLAYIIFHFGLQIQFPRGILGW